MAENPADHWKRIESLFDTVVDMEPVERERYLTLACAGQPELRAEIERLVSADAAAASGQFLDDVVRDAAFEVEDLSTRVGQRIGPWRIVSELGSGGMGAVFLAERADYAYAGKVAIKFVKAAPADSDLQRRFLAERQILADLKHPGIPRLLDGGTTEDGTPFLVMEYVEGEPITAHARRVGLGIRERLRLFLTVCDAVAHAHRSLIVHRDIKPSNVLVDREGATRLVDFGIAKPLGPDYTAEATRVFRRLTPAHASPEQIRGERITVATDVYALGLLLYELVSGIHPFLDSAVTGDIQKRVLEERIPPPSEAGAGPDPARPKVPRALAADLDAIALTALAKQPERRYASVEQMADDVERALDGRAILARTASPAYRVGRLIARNRAVAAVAGAVFLLAGTFAAVSISQLAGSRDAERAARIEAEQLARVALDLLAPQAAGGARDPAARVALDRARDSLLRGSGPPTREYTRQLIAMGVAYANLGALADAEALLDRAIRTAEASSEPEAALTADAFAAMTRLRLLQRDLPAARAAAEQAIALRTRGGDPEDHAFADLLDTYAQVLRSAGEAAAAADASVRADGIRSRIGPRADAAR